MVRRVAAVVIALLLIPAIASAGMKWDQSTPALKMMKNYIETASELLKENGEKPINRLFECYDTLVVLAITEEDNAEIPEGVTITADLYLNVPDRLQLLVNDPDRFPLIAASLIKALYGENMTLEDAILVPRNRAERAKNNPSDSFEETVEELNGENLQVFYAYYPNAYLSGENWLQMTIVFPLEEEWDELGAPVSGTEAKQGQPAPDDADPDYEGFYSQDDFSHFEFFVTPTPEPDSAAMEYDFR